MDAIKTIGLTKKNKDVTAVDGLDLTVRQGELLSLLGVLKGKMTVILTTLFPHIWWVTGYAAAVTAIAVFAFLRQMKRQ